MDVKAVDVTDEFTVEDADIGETGLFVFSSLSQR
jgi:hypothetical protein